MKRSTTFRLLTIGLISVSAFALSSCGEEKIDSSTFKDLQSCYAAVGVDGGKLTTEDCNRAFSEAQKVYQDSSPRYADKLLCEEEHGLNYCVSEVRTDGTIDYMPMFNGYIVGYQPSSHVFIATPIYHTHYGYYSSYDGSAKVNTIGQRTVTYKSAYVRPSSTVRMAPMTRVSVAARSGFNSSARISIAG